MPWQHFSFSICGPNFVGRVWAPDLGPGQALAGPWPGLPKLKVWDKVKYWGLDLCMVPNRKPQPRIDRIWPGNAQSTSLVQRTVCLILYMFPWGGTRSPDWLGPIAGPSLENPLLTHNAPSEISQASCSVSRCTSFDGPFVQLQVPGKTCT